MPQTHPQPHTFRRGGLVSALALSSFLSFSGRSAAQETPEEPPAETTTAPAASTELAERGPTALFTDFMHFARLGKFQEARAYATALLAHPDLDPVQLLDVADRDRKSFDTLVTIINHSSIGEEAKRVLEVLREGEARKAQDPKRINLNIEKLAESPQAEFTAIQHLVRSGEYAVPWMVQVLTDPAKSSLRPRVVRALPKLGQPAVTPLAIALEVSDRDAKLNIIKALGEIGYPHAVPYLKKLMANSDTSEDCRVAAGEAVGQIARRSGRSFPADAAQEFVQLADQYYREEGSLRADSRNPSANVWYWRDNFLTAVAVPREIFGPIMAMRSAEEALKLVPAMSEAMSLWLAADIRREARLGLDVESGNAVETTADTTRPDGFPRALYFSSSAGARYCHSVLERAVADQDAAVALGAIAALRAVAGEAGLVGYAETQQPLVKALNFPDALVRIKAALALAEARPKSEFAGGDRVVPVLAEALLQSGRPSYVVIAPDEANLNRVMEALRGAGAQVQGDTDFYRAMERGRSEFKSLTGLFISTKLVNPSVGRGVEELRREFAFGMTPIVLLEGPGDQETVKGLESRDPRVSHAAADATEQELADALAELKSRSGQASMSPEVALALALESADALLGLGMDGRTALNIAPAEPSLVAALQQAQDEGLRSRAAAVLAHVRSESAQRALATIAMDGQQSESLRVSVLESLSDSAKAQGNHLSDDQVKQLVSLTADESQSPSLRTAASKALGALNLTDNKASDLIRKYYRG